MTDARASGADSSPAPTPAMVECPNCRGYGYIKVECEECSASGLDPEDESKACAQCGGEGSDEPECVMCEGEAEIPASALKMTDVLTAECHVEIDNIRDGAEGPTVPASIIKPSDLQPDRLQSWRSGAINQDPAARDRIIDEELDEHGWSRTGPTVIRDGMAIIPVSTPSI